MGSLAEIKGLALLLASNASSFMTGGVYPIDGGALLQGPSLPDIDYPPPHPTPNPPRPVTNPTRPATHPQPLNPTPSSH
jgi:hypothetical protein